VRERGGGDAEEGEGAAGTRGEGEGLGGAAGLWVGKLGEMGDDPNNIVH
jgi:hypothetical protein